MSYSGISVREALERINAPSNGWYLPQVQRQYVWGERHKSEAYVCMLLDSLLKRYPIGGIVLWETSQKVPYRRFVENYTPGQYARQVDEGLWGASKSLVYDGQQRLQTLYSVLRNRFNGRTLFFDLIFDQSKAEADDTGFLFRDTNVVDDPRYLRMTELSILPCTDEAEVELLERSLQAAGADAHLAKLVRVNLKALWRVFVETQHKSIAYYSVRADAPSEVNEIFRRLNTGGVELGQLELVLGKIKANHHDYEEKLWSLSEKIEGMSGVQFSSQSILQFFHLIIKGTTRVDESRIVAADIEKFLAILPDGGDVLNEVFYGYLRGLFNINHVSIVPRWLAILPIAAYLLERKRRKFEWRIRALPSAELRLLHQYFILSQFCDWNTQTMVNAFTREAIGSAALGNPFPLEKVRALAVEKKRPGQLREAELLSESGLATKILMPHRAYIFHERKPQVDHIFPVNLNDATEEYKEQVDVLWNFQPMPAEVNNYKRARHPKEFFESNDGSKYWASYDFIPEMRAGQIEPDSSAIWDDYRVFLEYRKGKMVAELERLYGIQV